MDKKLKLLRQIKVNNTLTFLTKTSKIVRENFFGKIIAITGSCGKTSLKEILGKSFNTFSRATYSPKSFNNKFGVPLSLFNIDLKHDYGIFEIGMDKKGEIDELSKIVKPDLGIITNISYAHAKNFSNIKQIASAKAEIINNIKEGGGIVLNADDQFYNMQKKISLKRKLKVYTFSVKNKNANVRLDYIRKIKDKFIVSIIINNKKKCFFIDNVFENNIKNILAAVTIISVFKEIKSLNKNIFFKNKIVEGRGDISLIRINNKNIFLIDESYNSNPLSVSSAINNFDKIEVDGNKKHLILGDMLELGKHSKNLHIGLSKIINKSSVNNVHVFGKDVKYTYKDISKHKKGLILNEKSEIINLIKNKINNNDYLMIKGSNSTGLNKLTNELKNKEINAL